MSNIASGARRVRWTFWMHARAAPGVVASGWETLPVYPEGVCLGREWHGRRVYRLGLDPLPTEAHRRIAEAVIIGRLLIETRERGEDLEDYFSAKYFFTWSDVAPPKRWEAAQLVHMDPCGHCGRPTTSTGTRRVHLRPDGGPGARTCLTAEKQWAVVEVSQRAAAFVEGVALSSNCVAVPYAEGSLGRADPH